MMGRGGVRLSFKVINAPVFFFFCFYREESLLPPPSRHSAWNIHNDPDTTPPSTGFLLLGRQGRSSSPPVTQAFFPYETVKTLCDNTNKQAAKNIAQGKKSKGTELTVDEFYKYLGLVKYMAMVKLDHIADYWRQGDLFSLSLPTQIMSGIESFPGAFISATLMRMSE